uniref:Uncharacterized protein n=1 Tax=Anotrichium furcellatum TaxID=41999 RepID=A0A4D6WM38_9FLOR|nr:hypothetical protein [Anotrichium furcellatum]
MLYLFFIFLILWGLCLDYLLPASFNSFKMLILDALSIDIVFFVLFIRLYLGWSYILNRLLSASIFYEESGWYDGQIWIKKTSYLVKDRLIGTYYILPIIYRLKVFCLFIILIFSIEYLIYGLL